MRVRVWFLHVGDCCLFWWWRGRRRISKGQGLTTYLVSATALDATSHRVCRPRWRSVPQLHGMDEDHCVLVTLGPVSHTLKAKSPACSKCSRGTSGSPIKKSLPPNAHHWIGHAACTAGRSSDLVLGRALSPPTTVRTPKPLRDRLAAYFVGFGGLLVEHPLQTLLTFRCIRHVFQRGSYPAF